MKSKLAYILILFSILSCNEVKTKEISQEKITSSPQLQSIEVGIDGMTCEIGCARTIESKISKLKGVTYSKVDFEGKKGVFTYDMNITSSENIIKKITGIAGGDLYFPRDLKIYENIVK